MTNVLADIYNACDPLEPAKPEYYVDCSAVRGSDAFATFYQRELEISDRQMVRLFSGHIGCGKSSELEHVAKVIRHHNPGSSAKRYFPIILNAGDYLDLYDVTPTDILLAIIAEIGDAFNKNLEIKLQDNIFTRRFVEIKDFLLSEMDSNDSEISIFGIKTKIQRLQKDSIARQKIREKLIPQMSSLQDEINIVFTEARIKLKGAKVPKGERPYDDFVLIIDDLEKFKGLREWRRARVPIRSYLSNALPNSPGSKHISSSRSLLRLFGRMAPN